MSRSALDLQGNRLRLLVPGEQMLSFPLSYHGTFVLGRGDHSRIRLLNPSISRRHAVLRVGVQDGQPILSIEDLGSSNGTFVRGRSIQKGREVGFAVGEVISLGELEMSVQAYTVASSAVSWREGTDKAGSVDVEAMRVAFPPKVVVKSEKTIELMKLVDRIAHSEISVLIQGETGVGKEVIAHAVHARSRRCKKPFMAINCGGLPSTLLESELFGYERGAFTGANQPKPGLFEIAAGGTVFLDEVGELASDMQVKLLRVLEARTARRVGGVNEYKVDIRLVSATNRNLQREIAREGFREDLYYRLNGATLHIPPLRERVDEVPELVEAFCTSMRRREGLRMTPEVCTPEALKAMMEYSWPGNVRQLRNVVERAVVLAGSETIGISHLPMDHLQPLSKRFDPLETLETAEAFESLGPQESPAWGSGPEFAEEDTRPAELVLNRTGDLRTSLEETERQRIVEALEEVGGNQTQAAKRLGISRKVLINRLERYGVRRPRKNLA